MLVFLLGFILVGLVVLLLVIFGYIVWLYWVFRGKVYVDIGYY